MDAQRASEIQTLLEGVPLPAKRKQLVDYATHEDRAVASLLERLLPDREFSRLDEVGDELTRQPQPPGPPERLPQAESGRPPGGDDYTNPSPESGSVRVSAPRTHPPKVALEEQTKLQKKQQAKQKG
jgi:Protein of unknown function (DUF2795)